MFQRGVLRRIAIGISVIVRLSKVSSGPHFLALTLTHDH